MGYEKNALTKQTQCHISQTILTIYVQNCLILSCKVSYKDDPSLTPNYQTTAEGGENDVMKVNLKTHGLFTLSFT